MEQPIIDRLKLDDTKIESLAAGNFIRIIKIIKHDAAFFLGSIRIEANGDAVNRTCR